MAGLVPAIHVFASYRSARRGCVDARIKSGHDELGWHHAPTSPRKRAEGERRSVGLPQRLIGVSRSAEHALACRSAGAAQRKEQPMIGNLRAFTIIGGL